MPTESKGEFIDMYSVRHKRSKTIIYIYTGQSKNFSGFIEFNPKGFSVPQSVVTSKDPFKFELYWELDRYPEVIETLRYEKPIHVLVTWDTDNNSVVDESVGTFLETIGQQEGV